VDTDNVFAVLHYLGAPDADPKGKPKNLATVTTLSADTLDASAKGGLKLLDESDLHPVFNPEAPGGSGPADRVIDLNFHRDSDSGELEVNATFLP
jgi:iron transport multicopper oxidase